MRLKVQSKPNLHQAKSERTRELLLGSAMRVIQESGAEHLSIQAVAKGAGMTTGAVQHHFASKAAMMMQVLTRLLDAMERDSSFWPSAQWSICRRADHLIQQAWSQLYSQPRFATAWSAYLAARHDALVRAHIIEQRALVQQRLKGRFLESFPEFRDLSPLDAHIQFVFSTLRGLGLVQPFAAPEAITAQLAILSNHIKAMKPEEKS